MRNQPFAGVGSGGLGAMTPVGGFVRRPGAGFGAWAPEGLEKVVSTWVRRSASMLGWVLVVSLLLGGREMPGQMNQGSGKPGAVPYSPRVGPTSAMGGPDRDDRDPFRERNERSREMSRNLERQKRMVVEAERLLLLASELKATAAKAGTLSMDDGKKLEEIEKLARSVKTRMKD